MGNSWVASTVGFGHYPFALWSVVWLGLNPVQLRIHTATSISTHIIIINTSNLVRLAPIQVHAITMPPTCLTNNMVYLRSCSIFPFYIFSFLLMILVHVNLGFIWAKKNIFRTASFKSFLDKSKLVFLFLRANSFSPCCKASAFIFLEAFRRRPWQWYINLLRSVLDLLRCCCFFQLEYNSVTMCFTKQTKYHDWKEAHILVPLEKEKKKGKKKVKKDY